MLLKMFYNYNFSLKKVNRLNIFISIFFVNFCCCSTYDGYLSDFRGEKTAFIDNEEIIRRRSVVESYLKELGNTENDWIETYHTNFVESSDLATRKANSEELHRNEDEIHVTHPSLYAFQNVDFSSLKNSKDLVDPYESLYRDMSSGNPKISQNLLKKTNDYILQQSFKTDKDVKVKKQSLQYDNNQKFNLNVSKEKSKSNNFETKKPRKRQADSKSKSNKLNNSHIYPEMTIKNIDSNSYVHSNIEGYMCSVYNKDNASYSKIRHSSNIKNHDFQLDKFIEIVITNSEFISEKYFINSASLTLTEIQKLQKNLARLSFLQRSKNSVYSINRMNIIDSMGKLTPLNKQNEFIKEKSPPFSKFSNSNEEMSIESMQNNVKTIKKSVTDFKKRVSHKLDYVENVAPNRGKHSSLLESTNNEKFISSSKYESTDKNDFSPDVEILRRKKVMNSYLTTLNYDQKNWVETYDFSSIKNELEENMLPTSVDDQFKERKNGYNLHKTSGQPEESSKVYFHERSYIIRWINKLNNKIKDSQCSYCSRNILVSGDSLKILKRLSQEFDIVLFDELVNNMISNATMNDNAANMLYLFYENALSAIFSLSNYPVIYITITLLFSYLILCSLFCNTSQNFPLYRVGLTLSKHYKGIILITLLSFSLLWHGNKMYQQKIAEKHKVMSRVVPSYCESILNKESGVIAHFKEYFRWWYHDEDCKKYYEAVMVDPSSEISPLSISTDLFSETVFQMLQPFGRNMNLFFKTLTRDLTFLQQFFIPIFTIIILIVILCFCLLFLAFRWNYKVNFPFHMGSVEPTELSVGSRVQEVEEKESTYLKDSDTSHSVLQITYKNKTDQRNYIEDILLKENTFIIESKNGKLGSSDSHVLKISRTRHNSI